MQNNFRDIDIIKYIKLQKMRLAGYFVRGPDEGTPKKIYLAKPTRKCARGRRKVKRFGCLDGELSINRSFYQIISLIIGPDGIN